MKSKVLIKPLLLISLAWLMTSCGPTTELTKTWTDPSVNPSTFQPFKKVLVMARLKDQTGNRIAEDKIVAQIKSGVGAPSYSYLTASDTAQKSVDERLRKDGFDGLILMRLTQVDKSIDVHNSGYYGGYYGRYYGYPYGGTTTVSQNETYLVETSIYSLESGKLLWSGTTSTFNPSSLEKALDDIIAADRAQLIKQGFIKQ